MYLHFMPSLHLRLLVADPARDDVQELIRTLRAAGHVVTTQSGSGEGTDFVVLDAEAQPVPESLEAAESRHLAAVLRHTSGNRRQAALLLGVARSTLLAKIRKYGL
jgi:DNA-binding NtrC family response regulator